MFTDVRVVGVVGDDFGADEFERFHAKGIDTTDLERVPGERSFFWEGRYDDDMQVAQTLETQLNVFADFEPKLSEAARNAAMVFLANIQPDLQRGVREQCCERAHHRPRLDELLDRVGARVAARDALGRRRRDAQRRRGAHAHRRAEPQDARPRRCGRTGRACS